MLIVFKTLTVYCLYFNLRMLKLLLFKVLQTTMLSHVFYLIVYCLKQLAKINFCESGWFYFVLILNYLIVDKLTKADFVKI